MRRRYGLSLSQTEGVLQLLSTLLDRGLRIPDHSTLPRRSNDLNVRIPVSTNDGRRDIMIDSMGLRVHGGNVPGTSPPRRRAWRKPHIVVNADTGDVLASSLTSHRVRDAAQVLFGAHSRKDSLSPVPDLSGPSLVQARWDLPCTQAMAAAMVFPPGRHPNAPGRRDHPGYRCNMQVSCPAKRASIRNDTSNAREVDSGLRHQCGLPGTDESAK